MLKIIYTYLFNIFGNNYYLLNYTINTFSQINIKTLSHTNTNQDLIQEFSPINILEPNNPIFFKTNPFYKFIVYLDNSKSNYLEITNSSNYATETLFIIKETFNEETLNFDKIILFAIMPGENKYYF